jgi:hypothetical protein
MLSFKHPFITSDPESDLTQSPSYWGCPVTSISLISFEGSFWGLYYKTFTAVIIAVS